MRPNPLRSTAGFTYIAVLILVIVMGIMLGAVGQTWTRIMKREREQELIFRGTQIVQAIRRWNYGGKRGPGQPVMPLFELEHLLKDPRSFANVRYLRRLYTDPLTNKEWVVIKDPVRGIIGVRSSSDEEPLRQSFQTMTPLSADDRYLELMFKSFEGKKKYSEWEFVYLGEGVAPGTTGTVTIPGSNTTPGGTTTPGSRSGTPGG